MSVTGIGSSSSLASLQTITTLRNQLNDLQRQLGTGQKSDSYAGLGINRGLTVGLRSQLSAMSGYQDTITQVGVRLNMMQTALTQFTSISQQTAGSIMQSQFALNGGSQTAQQDNARQVFDQMVGSLNVDVDGHFLFSGSTVDQQPVDTTDHILNGNAGKAGLIQVIGERKQADLGASGLGRLSVGSSGTSVSLTEDAGPFGFKLAGATTAIAGATVTAPSAPPATMSVNLGATNPNDGDTITFTFNLPDGTTSDLTLTATSSATPGPGQFSIGASSTITAGNLQTALSQGLGQLANTDLVAASAVAAGNDFFKTDATHPPQRVSGPPFDTATALTDGTATTVAWYLGDNATTDPRSTAIALADQSLTVSYGARANEEGLRSAMQNMAVFAAAQFSSSDPNAAAQYAALKSRVGANLMSPPPSQQKVSDIAGQLAGAQVALNNSKDRLSQTSTTLQNMLQGVEGADPNDVAAQLLTLQTTLQATLQTTAMLLQTNLLKYLPG